MKVKSESEVTLSCPTLSDPMDYSLPGSSIHGIFQARVLEWGAIAFSGENRRARLKDEGQLCSLPRRELTGRDHSSNLTCCPLTFCLIPVPWNQFTR